MVCRECQSGKLHRDYVTYMTWIGNELITVPDFPAWVCDFCGNCEYDIYALNRLSLLLSPSVGRSATRSRAVRHSHRGEDPRPSRP